MRTDTGGQIQDGNGDGMRTRTVSRRAEEKQRRANNCTRGVDAIRHFHSEQLIIYEDRGGRLRAPDCSVCKDRCVYMRIAPRG